jgi:hypothetical protein
MYWNEERISKVIEVYKYSDSHMMACNELRKRYGIIVNINHLQVIKYKHKDKIQAPFLKHGGKRIGSGKPRKNKYE